MIVSELEAALFERFPRHDAEGWDHVGLSVGDPAADITGVAVALDATEENIRAAARMGANVLLTHHPVYIKAPEAFTPASPERPSAAATVYTAARLGVAVLSFHTNLDRSHEVRDLLPSLIGMKAASSLEHPDDSQATGLGSLCPCDPVPLHDLAARCACAFGGAPRVWGDADSTVSRVAVLGGSLGEFGELAIEQGAQAIVCGEAGYHVCQDIAARRCGVILLGHDRSEDPFTAILMDAAIQAGIDPAAMHRISLPVQWWTVPAQEQERS